MHNRRPSRHQTGSVLLEAIIAILIFSIGILSIVGLQAASIKQATGAKYRVDASLLANELIGEMWVGDRTQATLSANFSTGGPSYTTWLTEVQAALPGAAVNQPTVTIVAVPGGGAFATASSMVTINLFWKTPNDSATHNYTVIAQIK